jgi:putative ABC transport system ATP-binding protein
MTVYKTKLWPDSAVGLTAIEVKGLCKAYKAPEGSQIVLNDLDLRVGIGETIAIVGVSGTGKSTLLNILGGIDQADEGRIQVNGTEVTALKPDELTRYRAESVGFVFQFYNLISALTAFENVLAALQALGRTSDSDEARCRDVLHSVGLAHKGDKFPGQLSGGEQQRVAIARALVKSSPLVLADEPTGNLDPKTANSVMQLLIERIRESRSSLVMVTHDHAVTRYTDRAYEVEDGRLVERRI